VSAWRPYADRDATGQAGRRGRHLTATHDIDIETDFSDDSRPDVQFSAPAGVHVKGSTLISDTPGPLPVHALVDAAAVRRNRVHRLHEHDAPAASPDTAELRQAASLAPAEEEGQVPGQVPRCGLGAHGTDPPLHGPSPAGASLPRHRSRQAPERVDAVQDGDGLAAGPRAGHRQSALPPRPEVADHLAHQLPRTRRFLSRPESRPVPRTITRSATNSRRCRPAG